MSGVCRLGVARINTEISVCHARRYRSENLWRPEGSETFLLCRSASRTEKEKAIHERFSKRLEEGLHSLARRIEKSQTPLDRGTLERQIGRLLERNSRAAARYSIALTEDKTTPAGVKLKWSTRPEWDDWAKLTEGIYILVKLLTSRARHSAYIAGMTTRVRMVDVTMPPIIGAAIRFITSGPVPCDHMIGRRPAMIALTVIIFGRTRCTAPSMIAS